MKKIMVPLLFFVSSSAFAQKFEIGAKAGVNVSNFTGTDSWQNAKTNSLVGFHAGGFVSFFLGNNFAIQPELLFSTQGTKYEHAGNTENLKVSYLNIPVMFKYRSTGGFYIEAGPQVGIKTSEKSSTVDSLAKSTDLSVAGGIGFHSKMGLGIGARYTAGLSKIGDFKPQNGIDPDFKNGVIQVSIFYTLFNNRK
ncbi:MAG: porin family protein [Ferruginibacter sp.]